MKLPRRSVLSFIVTTLVALLINGIAYSYWVDAQRAARDMGNGSINTYSPAECASGSFSSTFIELSPGTVLVNETVLNPQLRHLAPWLARAAEEGVYPNRRYLLTNLQKGRRYSAKVSYLGSPAVSYEMRLMYVRADKISQVVQSPFTERAVFGPHDTEILIFGMSATNHLVFDAKEQTYSDPMAPQQDKENDANGDKSQQGDHGRQALLPVLEVAPCERARALHPEYFYKLSYALSFTPLVFNRAMDPMAVLVPCFALITYFFGYRLLLPLFKRAVENVAI